MVRRVSRLDFLHGREFGDLWTIPRLSVPGYTDVRPFPFPSANEATDSREAFEASFVPQFIERFALADGQMATCNKLIPHSITDAMLIQADDDVRSRYRDLAPGQRRFALSAAHEYVRYVSDPAVAARFALRGESLHMTYNTSAETCDRENGMGYSKRFHLHLNYWDEGQFEGSKRARLSELPVADQIELLDPFTPLAAALLRHQLERLGMFSGQPMVSDEKEAAAHGLPPGVAIGFPSWDFLASADFADQFLAMQDAVFRTYADLQEAFTGRRDAAPMWTRHQLLPADEIRARLAALDMPATTRERLCAFAGVVRSITPRHSNVLKRHKQLRTRSMLMNGANFSVAFVAIARNFEPKPLIEAAPVWVVVQAKMLSTLGSAGVFCNTLAPIVRVARNARQLTAGEEERRNSFQREFSRRIRALAG